MNPWDKHWFGPVAAIRPYLFQKCLMLLIGFDTLVLMVERGARYGLDPLNFNVAHFRWLDALHQAILPTGVPSAAYYVFFTCLTSFFAFTLFVTGQSHGRAILLTVLYTYCWAMSRLDSYLHHYMLTLILACTACFPRVKVEQLKDWILDDANTSDVGARSRAAWNLVILLLGLGVAYRIALSEAMALSAGQRWATMFACCGVIAWLSYRWQKRFPAGEGPIVQTWAFRLLATTVGIIYVFTAVAKMDREWCGGHTLKQVGTTAAVLRPIENLAGMLGVSPDWFWAALATAVIPLELVLAVSYLLAARQDEPQKSRLRRWCMIAWLLAIGLHLNNEMMNLIIQWFGYYMLFLATFILLPARILIGPGIAVIWPEHWLRKKYDEFTRSPATGRIASATIVFTVVALVTISLATLAVGIEGASLALIAIAAGFVLLMILGVVLGWKVRLLGISITTTTAVHLMAVAVGQSSMQFDYYDLRGKTLQQLGNPSRAIEEMSKALVFHSSPAAEAELRINLGQLLLRKGDERAAAKNYRMAIQLDPKSCLSYYSLGNLLMSRLDQSPEDRAEAERLYRRSISLKSDFSDAHVNLANILEFDGRIDEAIRHYRIASEIEPLAEDIRAMLNAAIAKEREKG